MFADIFTALSDLTDKGISGFFFVSFILKIFIKFFGWTYKFSSLTNYKTWRHINIVWIKNKNFLFLYDLGSSSIAFFLASSTRYLIINDWCLVVKCFYKLYFLCAIFFSIRPVGRPFKFCINVKFTIHSTLNFRFHLSFFFAFLSSHVWHHKKCWHMRKMKALNRKV